MSVQGIATSDFQALNELKVQAKENAKEALPDVAKQFEGIFLQSMLKSMRQSQHFLDESSPFSGKNQETFQDMLDAQYVSNIADSRGVGLAEMLAKQLERTVDPNQATHDAQAPTELKNKQLMPTNPNTAGIDGFVKSVWSMAKQAASVIGLDPKLLVAQAALETGWGKYVAKDTDGSTSNNLFNIKTGSNTEFESVKIKTTEYIADTPIKVNASFRKYPSVEQSFKDYISLIKGNERYQTALANSANPERYIQELNKAGYATDPNYSSKILSIYHDEDLNQAIKRCELSEPS
ncbi:glucosaminidase domain-containing protein [Legionella waltersii]|uniref:Muramidase, peptidoglycan hydrolase FlgJ n=1 Tax=Legionella waltersii TaxID=66969 RepID=A0A0W1AN00_9GAMM|nr:glucosaminidase domain-containing protein [Legionella waltersii]KTD82710.1 muramidase, peptidoglycan hydrolase FlgJ [Legionella waltersii]SNV03406.1 muramidase, peptidoglycan hydrolase FlgJ [Legionella waltersii]